LVLIIFVILLTVNKSIPLGGKCTQANSENICVSFLLNLLIYAFINKDMCRRYQQSCGPTAIHWFLIGWKRIHMWWWFLTLACWMEVLNCGSIVHVSVEIVHWNVLVGFKIRKNLQVEFLLESMFQNES